MPCQHRKKKLCPLHSKCPVSPRHVCPSQLSLISCPSMRSTQNISTCGSQNEEICQGASCPNSQNKKSMEQLSQCEQCIEDSNDSKQLDGQPCPGLQKADESQTEMCPMCEISQKSNVSNSTSNLQNRSCPSSDNHQNQNDSSSEVLPPCYKALIREIAKSIVAEQAKESEANNNCEERKDIPVPKLFLSGSPNQSKFTPRKKCCGTEGCGPEDCGPKNVKNSETELDLNIDPTSTSDTTAHQDIDVSCSSKACGVEQGNKKKRPKLATRTTSCISIVCPENECECHFPPEFTHFGCTGKISGSCSCNKDK